MIGERISGFQWRLFPVACSERLPCRVEDEEQDHGDSDTQALEPRYSHHCYVRADDRHASAIGPIVSATSQLGRSRRIRYRFRDDLLAGGG